MTESEIANAMTYSGVPVNEHPTITWVDRWRDRAVSCTVASREGWCSGAEVSRRGEIGQYRGQWPAGKDGVQKQR